MLLPANLTPLPVVPRDGESARADEFMFDDFVRAGDVRKVLLGSAGELPVEGLSADDFDSFAGRSDVSYPSVSRWTGQIEAPFVVPDMALEPQTVHPAFEVMPPARRATPPRPRAVEDCEATFGRSKLSDRWWVMGMGFAAAAILFSGTAVDFISREAVRRSRSEVAPVSQNLHQAPVDAAQVKEERPEVVAASVRPVEEP